MALTSKQVAERKRLIEDEGLTAEQANALVTTEQLDVPLDAHGDPEVLPPEAKPISLPPPLLP